MNSLQEVASNSQRRVVEYLKSKNIEHTAFWIDNKIAIFNCQENIIKELSSLFQEVREIIIITEVKLDLEVPLEVIRNETKKC